MSAPRQLSLNAFIYPSGHHEAAWRHPDSRPDRIYDVAYYQEFGRTADEVKILPGISPFIADTEAAAQRLEREFNELTVPEYGIKQLESITGTSLRTLALDEAVPVDVFAGAGDVTDNARSRLQVVAGIVERERPTLRGLLHRLAGARGHRVFAGTPEQVADTIEQWFTQGAADGFNVMPPYYPGGLEIFAETVVPILQERELFRTEYTGTTLREHFGLARPPSRFAPTPAAAGLHGGGDRLR